MTAHDAPEPDILLTSEPEGEGPVPLPSIALIVEVADTTLRNDLGIKQRVYASHGIPEYWIADVEGRVITRCGRQARTAMPSGGSMRSASGWRR